jgi:TrmH family RNA methyltransferase
MARLKKAGARTLSASDKVMAAVARKENPQMVVAAFHQRLDALEDMPATGGRRFVALYEVRDPGNLGTVIRTADAAGVDGVMLVGKCCDPFSVEAVRATMGSLFAMRLAAADFLAFDAWRRKAGASVVAASMHGTHRHDQAKWGERSIVLMGNEQSGLPAEVEAACDELVRIPMSGSADRLNLASAASVMIYEAWRNGGYKGANR